MRGNGRMIYRKGRELRSGRMDQGMKGTSTRESSRDRVNIIGVMGQTTMGYGSIT